MRVIKLTHGEGDGVSKACLMTASNMLIGKGYEGDNNSCVCPVIRAFIIRTNDAMPEELLGELYSPLIWEILGTRNPDAELQRAYLFADWAVRELLPAIGITVTCDPIVDRKSARVAAVAAVAARAAARAARSAGGAAAYVADVAADAADVAAYAADAADVAAYAADDAAYAARSAGAVAVVAADVAAVAAVAARAAARAAAASGDIWRLCPNIIRRAAAIGDKRPVEVVLTPEQLCNALS